MSREDNKYDSVNKCGNGNKPNYSALPTISVECVQVSYQELQKDDIQTKSHK